MWLQRFLLKKIFFKTYSYDVTLDVSLFSKRFNATVLFYFRKRYLRHTKLFHHFNQPVSLKLLITFRNWLTPNLTVLTKTAYHFFTTLKIKTWGDDTGLLSHENRFLAWNRNSKKKTTFRDQDAASWPKSYNCQSRRSRYFGFQLLISA